MHQSSYRQMQRFVAEYMLPFRGQSQHVVDIGSMDVNGTYRTLFDDPNWQYTGLDLAAGNGVDVVLSNPYHWREIKTASADVVVSGQALEHIDYFWLTLLEIERILKPDGLLCLLVPSGGYEHRYPVDCWRFYPDGLQTMADFIRLQVIEKYALWKDEHPYTDDSREWKDAVLIAQKPNHQTLVQLRSHLRNRVTHRVLLTGMPKK